MSWDILIQDFGDYADLDSIPDSFSPSSLGSRARLIERITAAIPSSNFSDPAWGIIDMDDGSVEANMGEEDVCKSVMLHVRGGASAFELVSTIVGCLPGRAFDCQHNSFLDESTGQDSFVEWRDYRDHVVADYNTPRAPHSLFSRIKRAFFGPSE